MTRTIYKCPECDSKIPTKTLLKYGDPFIRLAKGDILEYHKRHNEHTMAFCPNCGMPVNPKPKQVN